MYDNLLMHHLGPDRPSISTPYARKCSHGHMYYLLDTFGRSKSPTRLSGGWRRIVRQPSDAPPWPDRPSISTPYARKCSHGHMYYLLDTFGRSKSRTRLSGGWRRIVRQPSDAPPWPDRPTNSSPYARKCSHGHMYLVLETFGRSKSPTRLSGGWRRIVRQPSDAPPWPRSTVDLHFIRTKMFPRAHVPSA